MCSAVTSLVVVLMSASVYNFVLVNLDRLLVFKSPFQQQADSSRKNIKIGKYLLKYFYFTLELATLCLSNSTQTTTSFHLSSSPTKTYH